MCAQSVAAGVDSIHWVESFWIPLGMSLTVTLLLALYTGLVASRMFAFFVVRGKAVIWLYQMNEVFREDYSDPHEFGVKLGNSALGIMMEMRSLGHEGAKGELGKIYEAYVRKLCELLSVRFPGIGLVILPTKASNEWLSQMDDLRDFYGEKVLDYSAALASAKPSYRALFTTKLFPDYMLWEGKPIGVAIDSRTLRAQPPKR